MSKYKWSDPESWDTFCYVKKGEEKLGFFQTYLELEALERQVSKLQDAYDFNLDLLSEKERQLEDAREALSSIRGILPTVYSSDREIHEIINKVLKEQG